MNPEVANELLSEARSGSKDARERLMELVSEWIVEDVADNFIARNPDFSHLRDELESEGSRECLAEIDKCVAGSDPPRDIVRYLANVCYRIFRATKDRHPPVAASVRTQSRQRNAGIETTATVFELQESDRIHHGECDLVNLRDLIDSCCETQEEREVVQLRSEGRTDSEVGERLGLAQSTVSRMRQRIESRFNEKSLSLSA